MSANGRLRADELAPVQGTLLLATNTAAAWNALVAAVRAEAGVRIFISSPNGAYRSYADQVKLSGKGNHQYKPGYSVHGTGACVDINNWISVGDIRRDTRFPGVRQYSARLDAIAARFGFRRTYTGSLWEPWHYQHNGTVPAGDTSSGVPEAAPVLKPSGVPMFNLVAAPDAGLIYVQGPMDYEGVQSQPDLELLVAYRNHMVTPGAPLTISWGQLKKVQWYITQVSNPNLVTPDEAKTGATFTTEQLTQIDQVLADDFARVNANIDDQPTEFTITAK